MAPRPLAVCRGCGAVKNLERHFWWRPTCRLAYPSDAPAAAEAAGEGDDPDSPTSARAAGQVESAFTLERRRRMLVALTRWSVSALISDKWKGQIKSDVMSVVSFALGEVEQQLCNALDERTCEELMPGIRTAFDLFEGLSSARHESRQLHSIMPCLFTYERKVGAGKEDIAYTTVLADWLQLKMNYDTKCAISFSSSISACVTCIRMLCLLRDLNCLHSAGTRFCEAILASSEKWKTGELQNPPSVLSDITHGSYFRESRLATPCTEEQADDLRVGIILGYDDLELANPLGAVRGKHKVACFYVALANLSSRERFQHHNMCVLMLLSEKVFRKCGAVRVVAGACARTGQPVAEDWASFGAQFRESAAGNTFIQVS